MTPEALDSLLRQAPFFARQEPQYQGYEYRGPGREDTTSPPDACVNIDDDSIIFVDYGNPVVVKAVLAFIERAWNEASEEFAPEEL